MRPLMGLILLVVTSARLGAIEIRIDYTYDTGNFFNTAEKKAAIEAGAKFYGDMIDDHLLRIDPDDFTNSSWTPIIRHPSNLGSDAAPNNINLAGDMVIPEDVIIVYVGADNLSGGTAGVAGPGGFSASFPQGDTTWIDRIRGRGSAGAASSNPALRTDFSPWGGFISFDNSSRTWNFSLTTNDGTGGTEFLYVALHEMGHVLGVGTASSYSNLIDFAGETFLFSGQAVVRSNGGVEPVADSGHYRALEPGTFFETTLESRKFGSFGQPHGTVNQDVVMLPSYTDTGSNFPVLTDFDLAGFTDIGWEINPDPSLNGAGLSPSGVTLEWNSVSFKEYAVDRSTGLPSFSNVRASADGDATTQSWSDPSPPADKAFYQFAINNLSSGAPPMAPAMERAQKSAAAPDESGEGTTTIYEEPRAVECKFH